jgi:hypothetical protein
MWITTRSLSLSRTHTCTHTHKHARAHTHTHTLSQPTTAALPFTKRCRLMKYSTKKCGRHHMAAMVCFTLRPLCFHNALESRLIRSRSEGRPIVKTSVVFVNHLLQMPDNALKWDFAHHLPYSFQFRIILSLDGTHSELLATT